jgi:type IV pilus biogenesis protein CpaD/CtpE
MADPHKVRVKIGDAEFEAEGTEEAVKEQYSRFLDALAKVPPSQTPIDPIVPLEEHPARNSDGATEADQALLSHAFVETGDLVSLRFLPRTENAESDALLAILYGYHALKSQSQVLSTQLARAAAQSGVNVERVVRAMAKNEAYWRRGGARKGTYYSLNNQGLIKAKEILRKM